ncbi:MAG TPA: GGDEF domain-containing protein [Solirubrobacteraceae bacterium]|nr:GGDEF domain-containing protein [Solirubrobacteraceae bacterium]
MITRLRAVTASPAGDAYAGGDVANARRLGALLWLVSAGLIVLLLPLSPPDEAIGGWGWAVAGAVVLVGVGVVVVFARLEPGWDFMLGTSFLGAAAVTLMQWLAGGHGTPYGELFLICALYAAAVHPLRRLLPLLLAVALGLFAPLTYDGASAEAASQTATRLLIILAMALLAVKLMKSVRAQRVGLRDRGDRAEHLARHDELTGLPNRRAFVETLAAEVARVRRTGAALSVVVADLDGFKGINDAYGHPAGDACLTQIGAVLRETLRQYDSCFRWGGDEFTLILPETSLRDAEIVCDRVASAVVATCRAPDGHPLRITCAAAELGDAMTGEDLVAAADEALLARKRRGGLRLASTA